MSLFIDIKNQIGYSTQASVDWFRLAAERLRISGRNSVKDGILQNKDNNLVTSIEIGKLYYFQYDALHKDTLPYWDRYPLIFVLNRDRDGFLGLNMHYLRPDLRIAFFNKLQQFASDKRLNPRAKLAVTYRMISDFSQFPEVQHCIKRYLWGHVKTRWMEVPPDSWRNVVMLPLQSFTGQQASQVWAAQNKRKKR